ncbi:hypothetical protein ACWV26_02790 [Rummeliibacillus sp. JY-2-4R]
MKNVVKFLTVLMLLISIFPIGNESNAQAANSLSYNQVKKYQPNSKKVSFVYQQYGNGITKKATLKYNKAVDGWISNKTDVMPNLGYNIDKKRYLVGAPSSDFIYTMFEVPIKKGNVYKLKDFDGRVNIYTKVISTQQTVKVKAGTYKNCIVIKDQLSGAHYYFAKNVGLLLIKSGSSRFELAKVIK